MRYLKASILAAAVVLAVVAPTASAGTYTVYSCKTPSGAPNGLIAEGGGGWTLAVQQGFNTPANNTCDQAGGAITAALGAWSERPPGDRVEWHFLAPPATRLTSYALWWAGHVDDLIPGAAGGDAFIIRGSLRDPEYRARHYIAAATWVNDLIDETNIDEGTLLVGIACSGVTAGGCGSSPAGNIAISRFVATLRDVTPPSGTASGSALDEQTWVGSEPFAYQTADAGGGVYRIIVLVDGTPVFADTAGSNDGHCADATPGDGDPYVFNSPRPCQPTAAGTSAVDAASLPSGAHQVSIVAEDAAGNATTIYGPARKVIVGGQRVGPGSDPVARGAANGANPSDAARLTARWTRTNRMTLKGPYGRRQVIRGRLSDRGVGIRGARIELVTAIDGRPGLPLDKGGARTRSDGRFTVILPRNVSSRTLVLRYRSHANDTVAIAERTLVLKVEAGVKLTVRPRRAARGRTVRLTGRLIGHPLPRSGKVVEIQARSRGERWITFRTVRTSRAGRFTARYTFRRGGPALYFMRARVRAAADYPYATGVSRSARIRVR
jgi:hypothetical protein